jgi:hypothetical protein
MTETTQRFLRAIAERVPAAAIAEVRLFPALRQGQWESAVAVVTAVPASADTDAVAAADVVSGGRHTVYTARYRLAIKGPDRGTWEFDIRAEADVPPPTVDAVVDGVLERSGDAFEPERISPDEFQAMIAD